MLTGKVPFKGDTPVNIALKHINEYIDFEKDISEDIPKDIKILLYKLTQKQSDRYQNAYELINDIEHIEKDIELHFEEDYGLYHTQKLNSLNEELKTNIPKQLKEEGVDTNMRKKSKNKISNKKKMTILGVLLLLYCLFQLHSSHITLRTYLLQKIMKCQILKMLHSKMLLVDLKL